MLRRCRLPQPGEAPSGGTALCRTPGQHQHRLDVVGIALQDQAQGLFSLAIADLGAGRLDADLQMALLRLSVRRRCRPFIVIDDPIKSKPQCPCDPECSAASEMGHRDVFHLFPIFGLLTGWY